MQLYFNNKYVDNVYTLLHMLGMIKYQDGLNQKVAGGAGLITW